ncbi:hypothetical protein SM124_13175 [Bacillus sp. 31A1R]|uniref:Uncharacterized protein n=1 Tax=Robertmurraya mangrovi TaxID=3098077 RepID=A0ABU5IZU6_9BACI|nr:hypothetical protein [Bacillus sp. 31A1R]MDZ5472684.1 hypothetical protein [Bacillus sp. 31A1R]
MEYIVVLGIVAIAFSCYSIESSLRTTKKQNQEIIDLLREIKNK